MSFASEFDSLALAELSSVCPTTRLSTDVEAALARSEAGGKRLSLADFRGVDFAGGVPTGVPRSDGAAVA